MIIPGGGKSILNSNFVYNDSMRRMAGFAQIPIMVAMLVMAIALPAVSGMIKKSQDARNRAAGISELPGLTQFYVCKQNSCLSAGYYSTIEECNITQIDGAVCSVDSVGCCGTQEPPLPEENYYICDAQNNIPKVCNSKAPILGKARCESQIANRPGVSCVKDCLRECLNEYSVCADPEILKKCPKGVQTDAECAKIFSSGGIGGKVDYYFADPQNSFGAKCSSFKYDFDASGGTGGAIGEAECMQRFGKQNCFISNGDCQGMCPKPTESTEPGIDAYRCSEGTCQKLKYGNAEECYRDNGFAGCFNGCSGDACSVEKPTDYFYCDYSNPRSVGTVFMGTCKQGSYRNIYECLSKNEKCTLLNCGTGDPNQSGCIKDSLVPEDKKLKLYFCSPTGGSHWEIFKNWQECGLQHGTCYDVLRQSQAFQRCPMPPTNSSFYYLDNSYTNYNEKCRKGNFSFLEDCEVFANGCEAGMSLNYCKRLQGENFKNVKCFVDDVNCGRQAEEPVTIDVTPKFSKDIVGATEEFYLDIMADVQNVGKSIPDFEIKVCTDGVLDRVTNKENLSDCSFEVLLLPDSAMKCFQVKGTCNNKTDETLLARLWFVPNKANVSANFTIDWGTYYSGKMAVNIGSETRTCDTGENGDADKNGKIEMADFDIWEEEYFKKTGTKSDFNCDSKIDLLDFEIWRSNYFDKNNNTTVTPTPRPTECQNSEKKCFDNSKAGTCVNGFWKNTICGNGYKCNNGECLEVKCGFDNTDYSIGTKICKDRWTPSVCMSNGIFQDSSYCLGENWCKGGDCVPITCLSGGTEYKLGYTYCTADNSGFFICDSSGSFSTRYCPYGKSCKDGLCVTDPMIPTITPRPTTITEPVKCYLPGGIGIDVGAKKCINSVYYYCLASGQFVSQNCSNGCNSIGDDCAL